MHGLIHDCLKCMLQDRFGMDTWNEFVKVSGCDESNDFMIFITHKDEKTVGLIVAAANMLNVPLAAALELFGEYFFHYAEKRGFGEMLRRIGRNMESFLRNLDFHHFFMSNFIYGFLNAPSFRCEKKSENVLHLHYYSKREGLFPIVIGFARECGRQIFNIDSEITVIKTDMEKIEESGVGYIRHHTNFNIKLLGPWDPDKICDFEEWQSAYKVVSKWRPNQGKPHAHGLSGPDVQELLPFHIMFDDDLKILGLGSHLSKAFPRIKMGDSMLTHTKILHPDIGMSWELIGEFLHDTFVLLVKVRRPRAISAEDVENKRRISIMSTYGMEVDPDEAVGLELRGQMYLLKSRNHMLFIGSPRVVSLAELCASKLFLSDIPLHDVTRDLALLNQQRLAEVELSQELERTTAELKRLSGQLEVEKQKVDDLLLDILPKEVANSLKQGKQVEACSYEMVSVLFSDIVTFTVISSSCHPKQIVDMLNELFTNFDNICNTYDVYRVETIGDAYMIASGLPVPSDDHAVRLADTALSMIQAAAQVKSPVDDIPLRIRVGIHSGPVMTGVVGKKRPRYCLFGDTVNTASRMESHGVPGKIHISQTTFDEIGENDKYTTEWRGETEIKGKGIMNTYFLSAVVQNGDIMSIIKSEHSEPLNFNTKQPESKSSFCVIQ